MKKTIIISIMFLLLVTIISAAAPPGNNFCLHNAYTISYSEEESKAYCVFEDGNQCGAIEFLDKTCGQEYVKSDDQIPCRAEGESLFWSTEECCEGLDPNPTTFKGGYGDCVKLGFFQKIWYWFKYLF